MRPTFVSDSPLNRLSLQALYHISYAVQLHVGSQ